jgi:hypothetical protein
MAQFSFERDQKDRRRFILAVFGWAAILVLGILAVWWGFFGAEPQVAPSPTPTAAMQALEPPSAATEPPSDQTQQPPPASISPEDEVFGYGIATDALLLPEYTLDQVRGLGLGWIKQQVRWGSFELSEGQMDWSGYDAVVNASHERGLRVMLSVVDAPEWSRSYFDDNAEGAPPDDLAQFADFLGRMVDRYQGKIHAIEVWNEQNLDREWDTEEGVNPERYVEMLRLAYQAIKSRDSSIIVISGALSPVGYTATDPNNSARVIFMNDREYFQRMLSEGFLDFCDCIGVHHNGYNIPPDVQWTDPYQDDAAQYRGFWDSPDISWSFYSTLHWYSEAASDMKPLCITEFGWASSEGLGGFPPGFEFAQDNTLEEQSEYLVQAFQLMREWGFVRLAFLWNLDYANKGPRDPLTDPNAPYSLVDFNGALRPAYWAIADMDKP